MTDIQILTWVVGLGFGGIFSLMIYLHSLNSTEIKDVKNDLKKDIGDLKKDVCDLREEVKDIDRRLCRIEGAMMNKDCCLLKHEHKEKAE